MFTTYCTLRGIRPNEAMTALAAALDDLSVTGYDLMLVSAVADGYTIRVNAEESKPNYQRLLRLFGSLNISSDAPADEPANDDRAALRSHILLRPSFNPAGREGRFAAENRPGGN